LPEKTEWDEGDPYGEEKEHPGGERERRLKNQGGQRHGKGAGKGITSGGGTPVMLQEIEKASGRKSRKEGLSNHNGIREKRLFV